MSPVIYGEVFRSSPMDCLFWNVRVLGNSVAKVIQNNRIDIGCLEETKLIDPTHKLLKIIGPNSSFTFHYKNAREAGVSGGIIIDFNNKCDLIDTWE